LHSVSLLLVLTVGIKTERNCTNKKWKRKKERK